MTYSYRSSYYKELEDRCSRYRSKKGTFVEVIDIFIRKLNNAKLKMQKIITFIKNQEDSIQFNGKEYVHMEKKCSGIRIF